MADYTGLQFPRGATPPRSAPRDFALEARMPRWVLCCPQCGVDVMESPIYDDLLASDPFTSVTKPEFPDGSLSVVCPLCKSTSVYLRHQQVYRASKRQFVTVRHWFAFPCAAVYHARPTARRVNSAMRAVSLGGIQYECFSQRRRAGAFCPWLWCFKLRALCLLNCHE